VESKRATKEHKHSYFLRRNRKGANTHEIPIVSFARRLTHAGPASVTRVALASSVICVVTQLWEQA